MSRLCFAHCPIGDAGFNALGPFLLEKPFQVLQFQHCDLTSVSCLQIADIIRVGVPCFILKQT